MMFTTDDKKVLMPLIIIEGATATGKSKLAFELAQMFGSEIISADSRQIYRYMNIGTAKPTAEDICKVAHHLIDIITPDQDYSAGKFAKEATTVIDKLRDEIVLDINRLKGIPIVAGGTGFYVQALLEGLFEQPPVNEEIRKELDVFEKQKGGNNLHGILEKIDPKAASKIHPHDIYRLKRALEVWIATGKGISEHWSEQKQKQETYNTYRILITEDRDVLYKRINRRMEKMVEEGLIEEIKSLIEKGYSQTCAGFSSVGYKEFIPFVCGNSPFLECLEEAKQNTRNYAKRQITWYRRIDFNLTIDSNSINTEQIALKIRKYFVT